MGGPHKDPVRVCQGKSIFKLARVEKGSGRILDLLNERRRLSVQLNSKYRQADARTQTVKGILW